MYHLLNKKYPLNYFKSLLNHVLKKEHQNCSMRFSSKSSLDISGIYPPIITTFNEHGDINFDKLKFNIDIWKEIPFKGYVVLGSTGEFTSLSEDEKVKLVKFMKDNNGGKLIIAGSGCESTHNTIGLTNKMADAGANAALVVSPFFYKGRMTENVLYEHYRKVADSSKIPVILYSVPANTGLDLSAALITKLADHPNIIGLKDSGGDITKIGLIVHKTKEKNFQVLAGSAGFLYPALCIGCVGGVLALANSLGRPACELYQYVKEGKHDAALKLQHRLIGPNLCVTKLFGIPGVKSSMDMLGYHGGLCRSPLKELSSAEKEELKKEFKANGFL
ncbi:4-hydroxy-2-oxoglutarate aldolase, mitochondrial [Trichonephila clavata]|uniref:4-hydroxy-2-oxoglutarate aldolase, mitochondrial n=1 Tax=Trichonephila clavata TaxID=2740835 RepID=A0A8X6L8Z1_TRICU|nr:4-hydroxy-2-oxoglutarate aldolase, mitochondrial [Trichonephila clavata]